MEPFDLIRISGYCYSHDRFFYRQPAVVASCGPLYSGCIKVWMDQIPDSNGKFWFDLRFARFTLLRKGNQCPIPPPLTVFFLATRPFSSLIPLRRPG